MSYLWSGSSLAGYLRNASRDMAFADTGVLWRLRKACNGLVYARGRPNSRDVRNKKNNGEAAPQPDKDNSMNFLKELFQLGDGSNEKWKRYIMLRKFYIMGVLLAAIYLYEKPNEVVYPGRIGSWDDLIQQIEKEGKQTLYVDSGLGVSLLTPASQGRNGKFFRAALSVPFPHKESTANFIDYVMQQSNSLYDHMVVRYSKNKFEDYYAYAGLPLMLFIFRVIQIFTRARGMSMSVSINADMRKGMVNGQFKKDLIVKDTGVKFSDVLGCEEAKLEISEFVSYMKNPEKFEKLKARIPRGAILYGPPGTGKTMLAKALAGECGVKFLTCSGSDFMEMFVGVGAARVRSLFELARKNSPSIIFIDEIDAIATERNLNQVSFREKESTLNQLLAEMDGFNNNSNVVVVAGTNKFDVIDKAILRAGRFDRHIFVGPPDVNGRIDLFKHYLKPILLKDSIESVAEKLADLSATFTGASIAKVCNEAAIIATRKGADSVSMEHFNSALDTIIAGSETGKKMGPEEKKVVCIHEAGHAVVGFNLLTVDKLVKLTVVPRGKALGYAQYFPKDVHFLSKKEVYEKIVLLFGGRAAEKIIVGEITTSALDDLDRATKLAYEMVGVWGMEKDVGLASFPSFSDHSQDFFGENKMFQSETGNIIDKHVEEILKKAYNDACTIVLENKDKLLELSELLEEKEVVKGEDVSRIFGEKKIKEKSKAELLLVNI